MIGILKTRRRLISATVTCQSSITQHPIWSTPRDLVGLSDLQPVSFRLVFGYTIYRREFYVILSISLTTFNSLSAEVVSGERAPEKRRAVVDNAGEPTSCSSKQGTGRIVEERFCQPFPYVGHFQSKPGS